MPTDDAPSKPPAEPSAPHGPEEHAPPPGVTRELRWRAPDGSEVPYLVTAEWLVLRKREQPAAEVFHTYYRLAAPAGRRPLTFVFNGGPGASSAYLHLGALGPRRVTFDPAGHVLAPPVELVENAESWLAFTDLVFVDPVGTGLSRVVPPGEGAKDRKAADKDKLDEKEKEFFQLNRDLDSLGEFAQRFLSRHKRWDAPVVLAGESYGGFRTAKLARQLQEKHGVGLRAVIAISPALEWDLLSQTDYNVLSYVDTFCSMALAAAHHGRSRVFPAGAAVEELRAPIELFAARTLAPALVLTHPWDPGAAPAKENEHVFARAADFLGLERQLVVRAQGRVTLEVFVRELLRDRQEVVGLYDATITAVDPFPDRPAHQGPDPTLFGIHRLFASGINHWLRGELGVESDRLYELLNMEAYAAWKRDDQKHALDPVAGAVDDLRFAMSLNPHMKVLITHGFYDLVTPYFSTERLVEQMRLLPAQRDNLHVRHFGGGHMFYSWEPSRQAFRDWVRELAY